MMRGDELCDALKFGILMTAFVIAFFVLMAWALTPDQALEAEKEAARQAATTRLIERCLGYGGTVEVDRWFRFVGCKMGPNK